MQRMIQHTTRRIFLQHSPIQCGVRLSSSAAASAAPAPSPPPHTRVQASLKRYNQHVFVASNTAASSWQKRVEEGGEATSGTAAPRDGAAFLAHLAAAYKHDPLAFLPSSSGPSPIPMTLFDVSDTLGTANASLTDGDVLLFSTTEPPALVSGSTSPQLHYRDLTTDQQNGPLTSRPLLQRILQIRGADSAAATSAACPSTAAVSSSDASTSPPYELIAFVCAHAQRDARCGERGPPLLREIRRWAAAQSSSAAASAGAAGSPRIRVRAYPCSHIGGHEFAGNVLLFGWSKCSGASASAAAAAAAAAPATPFVVNDWFGLVSPSSVPTLLDAYIRFLTQVTQPGSQVDQLRRALLAQPLPPRSSDSTTTAAADAAACGVCGAASAEDPEQIAALTHVAHMWRGSMGMEKAAAKATLAQLTLQA